MDAPEAARNYSDLPEAREYSNLPQVVTGEEGHLPEPVFAAQADHFNKSDADRSSYPDAAHAPPAETRSSKRICGLAPRTFWIILAVGLVIVAAAVGGGVGGSLASSSSRSQKDDQASTASTSSTAPPTATTSATSTEQSASVTTTEVVGPTSTLYRDCPSSNGTLYSVTFGSTQYLYRKYCSMSIVDNGKNMVNTPTTNLDSCINLCAEYNLANATEIADGSSQPCNMVCWRNGFDNDDYPGQCFGATTQNSSTGGFQLQTETICDAAGWINQEI